MVAGITRNIGTSVSFGLTILATKEMVITFIALTILANIPTVSASPATYAKCWKACMNGAGNAFLVAAPVCTIACTPALAL